MKSMMYILSRLFKKCRPNAVTGSFIHPTSKVESGSTIINTQLDRHSFCGYDCVINNTKVGAFCSIANNVSIGVAGRHPLGYVSTSPVFLSHRDSVKTKFACHEYNVSPQTVIGNDVWIGEKAMIKAGIHIGDGAAIGMGSIVTKDVLPYAIVAGNPARQIRMRFDADTIAQLLKLQWWSLSEDELTKLGGHFDNPAVLLAYKGLR